MKLVATWPSGSALISTTN